ncbi:uncharacterized protein CTRU02_207960 [Colletotrichum truncatum]|uniref:Uncharacterized protein n=1 Tax=Colletotrichum truncatum TaxID=5467 RepID=A0ACC3Z2D0_COLTU|nr:uncharacterized protein CTRU02_11014 [Colletotrichum truncatum]KAF6786516.1 hypothetical protein CTRU02_11014 [Colletotrichum truncatum]
MALQERPDSGSSVIGVDVSTHRSLIAASGAALNFAASFHRDSQACRGTRERQRIYEIYRDKILTIDGIAANVAAAFLPVLSTARNSNGEDGKRWSDFERLAQRGKNMRDRESQHLQHQSGIIAAWGLECFDYYGWHALPLPLLRQLHDLAVLVPRWEDVVDLLNSKMLARHELRVLGGKNKALRVGEHSAASKVQASHSPVERSDILAALEWAQKKANSTSALQDIKKLARRINGSPIRKYGLKLDIYGMVVPDTDKNTEDKIDEKDEEKSSESDQQELATRPTKRTRLSSARHSSSVPPDTSVTYSVYKSRSQEGGSTILSEKKLSNLEPMDAEESEELEDSEVESETQSARNMSTSSRYLVTEDMHIDQGKETGKSHSPSLYSTTDMRRSSAISGVPGNSALDGTSAHSDEDETSSLSSWSEDNEARVSEDDEQTRVTTGLESSENRIVQQKETETEARMLLPSATEVTVEKESRVSGNSRGSECDAQRIRGLEIQHEQTSEAQHMETNLEMLVATTSTFSGQNQKQRLSPSVGLVSRTSTPSIVDYAVATSNIASDSAMRLGRQKPFTNPSGDGSDGDQLAAAPLRPIPSSTENNLPPQRRPTLLQTLQARHGDTVHRFVENLRRPHGSEEIAHQRRLQLDWLAPQRWASIYAEPESLLGRSCVSTPEDADVCYLGWQAFRSYAEKGYIFRQPVVIKQEFQDSGTYDIVDYVDMLWQRFPKQQVDVQNSMTGACSSMSLAKYCLAVANTDLRSSDAAAAISSVTNLRRLARADEPLLSRLPRFRLLSTLADRVGGTVGRNGHLIPYDVQGCLGFNLLSFVGAFSGSHVDPLVGSWTRCLSGVQIAAVATDLSLDDWRRFSTEGRGWSPKEQGRLIVLEQDDVLFMPPGLRVVRATFAPEPCLMEGGMLWDECTVPEILEGLLWVVENHACVDESIHVAFQLLPIIDALEKWLDDKNYVGRPTSQLTAAEQYQTVKDGIQLLRALIRQSA